MSGKGRRCPVDGMLDGGKGVRDWTGLGERREGVLVTGLGGKKGGNLGEREGTKEGRKQLGKNYDNELISIKYCF